MSGLLIAEASLAVRHGLLGTLTLGVVSHGLHCLMARGTSPGPGITSMSPALAGGFFTTGPPRKSQMEKVSSKFN